MTEEEKVKAQTIYAALQRAASMSQNGTRALQAFQKQIAIAQIEGKDPPTLPKQLLAPNLHQLAANLATKGLDEVLATELKHQTEDAEAMLEQATKQKAKAEEVLTRIGGKKIEA